MSEEKVSSFENGFKNIISVLITAFLLWIGLTVQDASNSIAILKNEVANIKPILETNNKLNALIMEQAVEIRSIQYRLNKLEKIDND